MNVNVNVDQLDLFGSRYKNINLPNLKTICTTFYNPKKYFKDIGGGGLSSMNREKFIRFLSLIHNILKIQKFYRRKKAVEQICPVSLEPVIYPVFAYKPKNHSLFIYYNLPVLANYLIETGDFRDPKTRNVYSDETLKKIDILLKRDSIKVPLRGVYKASKNKQYYKQKKDNEQFILLLERNIDDIVSGIRSLLENRVRRSNAINTLNTLYFITFKTYFKKLVSVSRESANILMSRTITSINASVRESSIDEDTNIIRDNIILFLYQLQFDELNI